MITSVVIKSSDFMEESENVLEEGSSRNREEMERLFSFSESFISQRKRSGGTHFRASYFIDRGHAEACSSKGKRGQFLPRAKKKFD